jgi:hypothetical protein
VGPRADLDAGARRKIVCPCRGSNPGRPARNQTLINIIVYVSVNSTITGLVVWKTEDNYEK